MLDIILIVLLTIILVVLLLKPKRINSSLQEIRDQVHSLHQKTSRYEQEIIGIRREVRNRLGALDPQLGALNTRIEALESQIEASINTFIALSESIDHRDIWWTTLSNDAYEAFIASSKPFDYEAVWWKKLSAWYREQQNWKCEACHLSLHKHIGYLHAHHIWGTRLSTPEDLMALCIGCHAEQPGHAHLKEESDYEGFMKRYGKKWRELRHINC